MENINEEIYNEYTYIDETERKYITLQLDENNYITQVSFNNDIEGVEFEYENEYDIPEMLYGMYMYYQFIDNTFIFDSAKFKEATTVVEEPIYIRKYITIQVDENNYVTGFSTAGTLEGIEYDYEEESDIPTDFYDNARYYQLIDGNLVFDENKYSDTITKQKEAQAISSEISELNSWFTYYDNQMMQYQRSQRLGVEFDKDMNELDNLAEEKAKRLKELK